MGYIQCRRSWSIYFKAKVEVDYIFEPPKRDTAAKLDYFIFEHFSCITSNI